MSVMDKLGHQAEFLDDRLTVANWGKRNLRKVFPEHWTFMFGEMALYSFIIVLLSGIYLTLWFKPSMNEVIYNGSYTPLNGIEMSEAYKSTLDISFDVRGGLLMRQVHHWGAMLFIASMTIHMIRVFFTGAHRPPRELNWLLGVGMLLLVVAANFTGYLLPWDQLAFWAITVGTSILSYIPLVGQPLSRLLLGGPEVGPPTLLTFYSLHISFIPLGILALMAYHFWRVRKDGGLTIPKSASQQEQPAPERVTTIPHLVRREAVWAASWVAILFIFSMLIPAPLEGIADPAVSPNPAKAPWYFLGIQELLLHFHPLVGAVIIPALGLAALALLPFYDVQLENIGVYFRSYRGRYMSLLAAGGAILLTPLWVVLDEFVLDWAAWLPDWPTLLSNGAIPLAVVLLGLFALDEVLHKALRAKTEERVLALFIFLFTALVVLTIIGIFFRGPGMALYWPWEMPTTYH